MSLAIWIRDLAGATVASPRSREAFGILFFYFYGLVFGALAILMGAFLLRRIMTLLKCKTPLHWAIAAAILAPLLVVALGGWGMERARGSEWNGPAFVFALRSDDGISGGMVAGDSGGCSDGIFIVQSGARVRCAAARWPAANS